jgi:hypothetical protein
MADRDTRFDDEEKNRGAIAPVFKDRDEICGFFFAGVCRGASPKLIAEASGINYRTAIKLLNLNIKKYVRIKQEFHRRGEREFGDLYYTDEIVARLEATQTRIKQQEEQAKKKRLELTGSGTNGDAELAAPRRRRAARAS